VWARLAKSNWMRKMEEKEFFIEILLAFLGRRRWGKWNCWSKEKTTVRSSRRPVSMKNEENWYNRVFSSPFHFCVVVWRVHLLLKGINNLWFMPNPCTSYSKEDKKKNEEIRGKSNGVTAGIPDWLIRCSFLRRSLKWFAATTDSLASSL